MIPAEGAPRQRGGTRLTRATDCPAVCAKSLGLQALLNGCAWTPVLAPLHFQTIMICSSWSQHRPPPWPPGMGVCTRLKEDWALKGVVRPTSGQDHCRTGRAIKVALRRALASEPGGVEQRRRSSVRGLGRVPTEARPFCYLQGFNVPSDPQA